MDDQLHQLPAEPVPLEVGAQENRIFAALVIGVGVKMYEPEQLPGRFVDGGERHRAPVIELGQPGDERMAEVLHRREEPQPQVLRRHLAEQRVDRRLVLGTQRPHEHPPAVGERDAALPLLGIGPHREARVAGALEPRLDRRDRHAGIERQHAGFIGQQRVDVELTDLRQVGCELRDLDQRQGDVGLARRRDVAVGLEHPRDAGARDQVAGELHVERRQRQRLVVDDLDRGAAAAEYDDRPEGRIVGDPGDELARFRAQNHRLDDHPGNARVRSCRARLAEDLGSGVAHRLLARKVQPHAADVGFVHDVPRLDLHHDGAAAREKWLCRLAGLLRIFGKHGGNHRDRIGREQAADLDGIEPAARIGQRRIDDAPRRFHVRREMLRQARRRRHQVLVRFGVAREIHETADRVGFGFEMRDFRRLERVERGAVRPDPDCEHRLRPHRFRAVTLDEIRHPGGGIDRRSERGRHVEHQDRVVLAILDQRLERRGVALRVGVADDVDRIGV